MKLDRLRSQFDQQLSSLYQPSEIRKLFTLVISYTLQKKPTDLLLLSRDFTLTPPHSDVLQQMLSLLVSGKPIQYILHEAHFLGKVFYVDEHVLIPRPETEELVDWIYHEVTPSSGTNWLDIGTGSGCIAISLKHRFKEVNLYALDLSLEALAIAERNADNHKISINFIAADVLHFSSWLSWLPSLDLIIANPPYVRKLERTHMHANVLNFEPAQALFVTDDDPLIFYNKIADIALDKLVCGGSLFLEINQYLSLETQQLLISKGFHSIEVRKDLSGFPRMIRAKK